MLLELNGKVGVPKDVLVPAFYNSLSTLKSTLNRYKEKPYGPKRLMLGGRGRMLLVDYDTLWPEIQQGIDDPRKCDHQLERYYKTDADAVRFYTKFRFDDGTYLTGEQQERYITNASVLAAVLRLRAARLSEWASMNKTTKVGLAQSLNADAISFNKTLLSKHKVEHNLPKSVTRFMEEVRKFEKPLEYADEKWPRDYLAIISGKHRNANSRKVFDHTLALLKNMFADRQEKPTATKIYRQYESFISGYVEVINNATGELYDPKGFKSLSAATVKNYLAQWENKIGTYAARSGDRQKLMGQFSPYHSLDRPKYAGSIISIDDRQPPFKTPDGKRVWFYNAIDLGSEAFTCWVYGDSKEGIITEFYRQLVRNYHEWGFALPAEVEAEMSLNSSFTETFLREGAMFQYVRIEANKARAKRIERYNRTLRYEYEKDREGWLARPHALSEANQAGVDTQKVPRVPYEKIVEGCLSDIERWNNAPHAVHTEMSRWEVFCEMQNPDLQATNYLGFLPHIGRKTPSSVNLGIIHFRNAEYLLGEDGKVALGSKLIGLMKRLEGKDIDICWLDANDGSTLKALIYHDGQYVCEAVGKPRYNRATIERTPEQEEARRVMSSYQATIDAFGRQERKALDGVTVIDNRPQPEKKFVMPGMRRQEMPMSSEFPEELPVADDAEYPTQAYSQSQSLKDTF